jgi:hypothetical protein
LLGIDEFLRDLVEVTARSFDGRPAGPPFAEEEVVLRRPDDFVEVLEDEGSCVSSSRVSKLWPSSVR